MICVRLISGNCILNTGNCSGKGGNSNPIALAASTITLSAMIASKVYLNVFYLVKAKLFRLSLIFFFSIVLALLNICLTAIPKDTFGY